PVWPPHLCSTRRPAISRDRQISQESIPDGCSRNYDGHVSYGSIYLCGEFDRFRLSKCRYMCAAIACRASPPASSLSKYLGGRRRVAPLVQETCRRRAAPPAIAGRNSPAFPIRRDTLV